MRISTIRAYIEAAGGILELHARFDNEDILIGNFSSKNKLRRDRKKIKRPTRSTQRAAS